MKKLKLMIALSIVSIPCIGQASDFVNGYTRRDGTYVQPHFRSERDGNPYNNYSTQGNINPYTGQVGTQNPYGSTYRSGSSYNSGYGSSSYGYGSDDDNQ